MQIIAIANQKGGVAKTTTAVNLSVALNLIGKKKVLLIDLDPQGNATTSLGIDKNALDNTVADVLLDGFDVKKAIVQTRSGIDVLGANRELAGVDMGLASFENPPLVLKTALSRAKLDYDYVLIDCAPSLSLLTVNALVATDGVIIPMQCEYYALEGVADLVHTIEKLKNINPNLHIKGVVRTLYDARNALAGDVSKELEVHFGKLLYKTAIPRSIRLAEAPSFGQSIFDFHKSSKGAIAYQNLAEEVLAQG